MYKNHKNNKLEKNSNLKKEGTKWKKGVLLFSYPYKCILRDSLYVA
jgi:hypothetical protein